jgi:DDE domain
MNAKQHGKQHSPLDGGAAIRKHKIADIPWRGSDTEDLLAASAWQLASTARSPSLSGQWRWVNHFKPKMKTGLRNRRPKPHTTSHLDEVYLKIDCRMVYLWRAVDAEGEALDVLVQSRRTLKLLRKLLKKYSFVPDKLVTDDL